SPPHSVRPAAQSGPASSSPGPASIGPASMRPVSIGPASCWFSSSKVQPSKLVRMLQPLAKSAPAKQAKQLAVECRISEAPHDEGRAARPVASGRDGCARLLADEEGQER